MPSTCPDYPHRPPGVTAMALWSIVRFKVLPNYKIVATILLLNAELRR